MTWDENKFIRDYIRNYYKNDDDDFAHCEKCKHKDKLAEEMPCLRCRWCYADLCEEDKK